MYRFTKVDGVWYGVKIDRISAKVAKDIQSLVDCEEVVVIADSMEKFLEAMRIDSEEVTIL